MKSRPTTSTRAARPTKRWLAATVATTAALAVAGTGSPAASAPDDQCPAAFPVADLAAEQPVTGLTVSKGTTPDPFTGEVLGVLEDGIMPGLDMIMVRLTSPEIDRVGIWSGMSGSPVYAADGRLIGAVSYGLAFGPSTVAGVTPAADMHELLDAAPAGPAAAPPRKVAIPDRVADRLLEEKLATAAEVEDGLAQLRLPFGMAGLSQKRLTQVAKKLDLDLDGMRLASVGTTAVAEDDSFVAGGNVAAALSYGDITAAGVGTVTAVCGGEVLGFGHPMMWSGPSSLSMHAATALYIQEDPTLSGFKLANIDKDPAGTVTEDRMAAILGELGAGPTTGQITSTVHMGAKSRAGQTQVAVADWFSDIAFSHVLANQDRVFDGFGKGGADLSWTVQGKREDGTPFSISRDDIHASDYDITIESAWEVLVALYTLEYNGVEDITIDSVDFDSELTRTYDHYRLRKTELKRGGSWNKLKANAPVVLQPGKKHEAPGHAGLAGQRHAAVRQEGQGAAQVRRDARSPPRQRRQRLLPRELLVGRGRLRDVRGRARRGARRPAQRRGPVEPEHLRPPRPGGQGDQAERADRDRRGRLEEVPGPRRGVRPGRGPGQRAGGPVGPPARSTFRGSRPQAGTSRTVRLVGADVVGADGRSGIGLGLGRRAGAALDRADAGGRHLR